MKPKLVTLNEKESIRPFLKWPGGKFRLIDRIKLLLPNQLSSLSPNIHANNKKTNQLNTQLIEPFVGSGAVFLNTQYDHYLLNDANRDLITLYQTLQQQGMEFIKFCQSFFTKKNNNEKKYYNLREQFNETKDLNLRSAIFLYLNRHGYNGLCRYNKRKGHFNVPFGRYKKPYFPESEMLAFYKKSQRATFVCGDFSNAFNVAKRGSVIYCDPPYVPLTETAKFTAYHSGGFSLAEQEKLATLAKKLAKKGIPVLISNHCTEFTKNHYKGALIKEFPVQRFISCKSENRLAVSELLALFGVSDPHPPFGHPLP